MNKKPFLKSSIRDIDEELAKIDLNTAAVKLTAPLPGEEVIGELNDFEKRAMIWVMRTCQEMMRISKVLVGNGNFLTNKSLFDQYVLEMELAQTRVKILRAKISVSLGERFGADKPHGIRSNFKVVVSNKPEKTDDEEPDMLSLADLWKLHNLQAGLEMIN